MKILFLVIIYICLLTSCTTPRKVSEISSDSARDSARVVMRDSVVIEYKKAIIDSIVIRDSVVIIQNSAGVIINQARWHNRESFKNQEAEKTEQINKTDTIILFRDRETTNESIYIKQASLWEKLRSRIGLVCCLVCVLLLFFGAFRYLCNTRV